MKLVLWIFSLFLCTASLAQSSVKYTVKPGIRILDVIPLSNIYRYPDFNLGTVLFRNGLSTGGMLNYNALIGEVQFIDPQGDTLSLANEETIKYVLILKDTFYYKDGYLRLIAGGSSVRLVEKTFFKEFVQKPGAYDLSSGTTASNNISAILDKRSYELNTDQEVVLIKSTLYFFGNKYNEFIRADRKSLFRIFPKQQTTIEIYLNKNDVNFNKQEDLKKLVDFLAEIK